MPRGQASERTKGTDASARTKKPRRYARKLPRVNNAATVIQRWWRLQQYRLNAQGRGKKCRPAVSVRVPGESSVPQRRGGPAALSEWVAQTNQALSPHTQNVAALKHVAVPGGNDAYAAGRYASPRPRGSNTSTPRAGARQHSGAESPRSRRLGDLAGDSAAGADASPFGGSTQRLQEILQFLDTVGDDDSIDGGADDGAQATRATSSGQGATPGVLQAATELEISEQGKIIVMLRESLKEQRQQEERRIKKLHHAFKTRTVAMQKEHESALGRQLDLVDRLVKDKTDLAHQCEKLTKEMAGLERRLERRVETLREEHQVELKRQKEIWAAGEKIRKEQFIAAKTKEIRDTTIKGLEPEVQRLISKHKNDQQKWQRELEQELLSQELKLKKQHQAEVEALRTNMAKQRDEALEQERSQLQERLTTSTLDTEEQLREQMKRFTQAQTEERRRHDQALAEQKQMFEDQVQRLKEVQEQALQTQKEHYESSLALAQERQASSLQQQRVNDEAQRRAWEESKAQEHAHILATREAELKERLTRERDEQINVVLLKLKEKRDRQDEEREQVIADRLEEQKQRLQREVQTAQMVADDCEKEMEQQRQRADTLQGELNEARARISNLQSQVLSLKDDLTVEQEAVLSLQSELAQLRRSIDDEVQTAIEDHARQLEAVKKDLVTCQAERAKAVREHEHELRQLVQRKAHELDTVHEKVRATIQKKDERIEALQKKVQEEQGKQAATLQLLEKQRAAYLS